MVGLVFNMCRPRFHLRWVRERRRGKRKEIGRRGKGRKEGGKAVRPTSKVAVPSLDILKCPDTIIQTRLILILSGPTDWAISNPSPSPCLLPLTLVLVDDSE